MLGSLLGGFIDKEQITRDHIQDALERVAAELQCSHTDFFISIKPTDEQFNQKYVIYKTIESVLAETAKEFNISYKDIFIFIKPKNENFNVVYFVGKYDEKGNPIKLKDVNPEVREISLKEILTAPEAGDE